MNLDNLIPGLLEQRCICAPELDFNEQKTRIFDNLYETTCHGRETVTIDYNCEFPKHEFLTYLVENKNVLLHGSNEKKIRYLVPMRRSSDPRHVGNLNAIYACSDGIWPIFFAVWERRYFGVSSNSCFWAKDAEGKLRKYYGFFLAPHGEEVEATDERCWTDGMVYILPRDTFTRLVDDAGNPLEEWASTAPVQALARLPVTPRDFIFLDEVAISEKKLAASSPPPQRKVDTHVYDAYIGAYEISPDLVVNIKRQQDHLLVQATGYPTIEMVPESETDYQLIEINGRITFLKNDRGDVTQLALRINGAALTARKIS